MSNIFSTLVSKHVYLCTTELSELSS